MAKVKLKLQEKSDSELVTFSQQHIAAMNGNANFAAPTPSAADYQAAHDAFETAVDQAGMAQETAKQKTAVKDTTRTALERALSDRGNYVEIASGGEEAKILSSNLPVRDTPAPVGPMPAPVDFLANTGDLEGEIDLTWSRVRGAKSYIVQQSPNVTPRTWQPGPVAPKSKVTVSGCTPGTVYAFRVAAIGAAGQGPWSDESVKMAQ